MKRLLLVEDQIKDLKNAAEVAESLGIENVETCRTVNAALSFLERGIRGESPLPDGIILDLDLGLESGFELLRLWHGTPQLAKIPVMIWSIVEEQREVCQLFKVDSFVSKWDGMAAFREALSQLGSVPRPA